MHRSWVEAQPWAATASANDQSKRHAGGLVIFDERARSPIGFTGTMISGGAKIKPSPSAKGDEAAELARKQTQ